ncbi:D-galactose/ D-glucose-binding protein [Sebaldella termitidis]|jgi:methyl-galactoside transport system substrate-binding protein|uniref:D-galactose/methyl-galactoside binding periplasmic protein MglB n=1 Tax=Sebaldella termitidis (strain ATCC 33386 / NCTC 11300) TaxID=526218 RepID=D1AIH6_SEBTE|nr:galactose ABC transporter substrate-binding protein [Sebaldella termitidis]ACZ08560.1 galactose-binding protein [Sebaldella termitidis ATCC 33386]SUI23875.1 D-galactose/ D-glucose-binding protein [Sebaldella termitidis]
MKKFRWTMILSIIMLLISCGNGGEKPAAGGEAPAGGEAKKEIKIGVALYKFDDTFISSVKDAINEISDEKSKETGEKITINAVDGQGQQATQNDQVDTFITQGYDVIAVNMVDRTAASVIIQKAQAAGIPVVFFNREPVAEDMAKWDQLYYVGAKAEESGTIQGEVAADYFKANPDADKNKDGKIQYVILEGEPGHQDALLRTEYSIKALEAAGFQVDKLASDTALWQRANGQEKMAAWISAFGDKIELVLANNDDMALGAIEALKAAGYLSDGKFIPVIGVDATAPAKDSLKAGLLYGTVLNDARGQGKGIFDIAYALAKKENPAEKVQGITDGKYLWIPYQKVTKENVDKF